MAASRDSGPGCERVPSRLPGVPVRQRNHGRPVFEGDTPEDGIARWDIVALDEINLTIHRGAAGGLFRAQPGQHQLDGHPPHGNAPHTRSDYSHYSHENITTRSTNIVQMSQLICYCPAFGLVRAVQFEVLHLPITGSLLMSIHPIEDVGSRLSTVAGMVGSNLRVGRVLDARQRNHRDRPPPPPGFLVECHSPHSAAL